MAGQRSTTAKHQTYWPKRRLQSPIFAVRKHSMSPDISMNFLYLLPMDCGAMCRAAHRQRPQHELNKFSKSEQVAWRYSFRQKTLHDMRLVICSAVYWLARQTTKRGPRQNLDSWERLGSAFVAAPPLSKYSKLFIPCRPFLSSSTLFVPSHFIERGGRGGLL